MSLDARFDMPPKEAVAFFRAKGLATTFSWQDMWHAEHDAAFTVAKMMDVDLLRDVKAAVDSALSNGETFETFRTRLEGRLMEAGWWGKGEVADPTTGELQVAELGSARRLRTIFQTNLQTAYSAGHWEQIQQAKEAAPYLLYDAVMDEDTREEHAEWNGTVLPVDDAWWQTHNPPNGWNCRCSVVQLSAEQLQELGLAVADQAPPSPLREYTNTRTGEVSMVPKGIDPGFAYNPGAGRLANLQDALATKRKAFDEGK